MAMLPLFLGMRVKLTKKIAAPELVQEASGEVVGIVLHDEEGSHTATGKPSLLATRLGAARPVAQVRSGAF